MIRHNINARYSLLSLVWIIALYCKFVSSLKHHLVLTEDNREQVSVSSFGYNLQGKLDVIVQNLTLAPDPSEDGSKMPQYGFVIVKSNRAGNPYAARPNQELSPSSCLLNDPNNQFNFKLMVLGIYPEEKMVYVQCTEGIKGFPAIKALNYDPRQEGHSAYHPFKKRSYDQDAIASNSTSSPSSDINVPEERKPNNPNRLHKCPLSPEPIPLEDYTDNMGRRSYAFNFTFRIEHVTQEGNYYMSFHNCRGYHNTMSYRPKEANQDAYTPTRFNLSMYIYETNYPDNFLSAGLMPLPQMYFMLSVMFFLSGCIWINFISHQKESMLKIHNMMTVLVFAKAFSLLFHSINYHYIQLDGQPVVTWAYLYYATRAVKGLLFFITLALIGSGWTFIKHILSPRDKTMILAIVALQIIAHIAEILLDESTEGQASIEFWWQLCGLVDLFSCIFILLPITWSVRHLEAASRTDGKAAISLKRLELFKSFYIVSTVYIYVTRIMTFVFLSMLTYKYSWMAELFSELATLIYFIVTGYYFQPMPTNPYLLLSSDADMEEDILFSVDTHEMNGLDPSVNRSDRNTLLVDESANSSEGQSMKRRIVEELA